jgi:hypothetical protein
VRLAAHDPAVLRQVQTLLGNPAHQLKTIT